MSTRNRRLPQQRPLRARLPTASGVARACAAALRRAAPALLRASAIFALAGVLGATYTWLHRSPRFALRSLTVAGNAVVGRDEILRRAGVEEGQNVFGVSIHEVEARVARSPWVASVEARRRLPDGLEIRVVERQPAALVSIDGAGLYLADAAGRVFKRAELHAGEGAGLVVVSGLPRDLFGGGGERAAALVAHALHVAGAWAGHGRPAVGEVHLGREGVTLRTLEGSIAIVLGRGDDEALAASLHRFDAIWGALAAGERARARRIHLDSFTRPDRVTVSLAESWAPAAGRAGAQRP